MSPIVRLAGLTAFVAAGSALAGPDWTESFPGAGDLPGNAQLVNAPVVATISGTLQGPVSPVIRGVAAPDFEDMYRIYICDPLNFSARTDGGEGEGTGVSGSTFDSMLWLFDAQGHALLGNNDSPMPGAPNPQGSLIRPPATDGTLGMLPGPGFYFLAISGFNNVPQAKGMNMFAILDPLEISGPDGPGGLLPITGWSGPGAFGSYTIALTGVCPSPGCAAAMGIAGLCAMGRRRRV